MMLSTPTGEGRSRVPRVPSVEALKIMRSHVPQLYVRNLPICSEASLIVDNTNDRTAVVFDDLANGKRPVFVPVDLSAHISLETALNSATQVVFAPWN